MIWKKNSPFLYDVVVTHELEWCAVFSMNARIPRTSLIHTSYLSFLSFTSFLSLSSLFPFISFLPLQAVAHRAMVSRQGIASRQAILGAALAARY